MKAFGLSMAVIVVGLLAGEQAQAHFLAMGGGHRHSFKPPGGDRRDIGYENRYRRGPYGGGDGLYVTPDVPQSDETTPQAEPVFVPVPQPFIPIIEAPAIVSQPHIIIVNQAIRPRPRGALPEVIYGVPPR